MKKTVSAVLILLSLAFAGCFDIKEEIFLEKNGSGTYVSTIDMTQMKEMLNMMKSFMPDSLKEGKEDDLEGLGSLDSLQNLWKDIDKVPGISNVQREKKSDMIFTVSFKFSDMKALNTAMTKRNQKNDSLPATISGDFYSFSKGNFSCNDTSFGGLGDVMKGLNEGAEGNDSTAMAMNMLKGFMGDMKYTSIYHMPGKISDYSNKNATLSPDGRTITLEINLSDSDKRQTLENKIRYK
ncbi:hypothetical protein [Pollutibacter soli]|uniref:hypothetical protein n=1 Tax=Pollutibacter soli TaxID=3034157 RepID=UPI0030137C04